MKSLIKLEDVEKKIITIRNKPVIIDSDVAKLYGIETKDINRAVKNNPEKFPEGYIFELSDDEHKSLRSKIFTLNKNGRGQHTKYLPKAFTEKGLYMLATILKSKKAIQTTIAIVETFAKFRELSRTIAAIPNAKNESEQKSLTKKTGEIIGELLDDGLSVNNSETTIELNLAMIKIKHTINRKK
jgi:phage regulator Rha-like protein